MAKSATTYVPQLVNHMKKLTMTDEDTLFTLAVEHVDGAAEKLALLSQGNVSI